MTILRVCKIYVLYKKPFNKPLINLDRLVITWKCQTSVFYVWTLPYEPSP